MSEALRTASQLKPKKLAAFKSWLAMRGAELLVPTNEWEIVRFKAQGVTAVVYQNSGGRLSLVGPAEEAWTAYRTGKSWDGAAKVVSRAKRTPLVKALIARDGHDCFFCGKPMEAGDETVEHLVPIICGGTNHIANLALAHARCNQEGGNLSVVEKIRLRETMRFA